MLFDNSVKYLSLILILVESTECIKYIFKKTLLLYLAKKPYVFRNRMVVH
jgi:hypothetical protein